jgi:hypothetical protein
VTIAAIAIIALLRLASTGTAPDWTPVYQDVLKTSFGALAVGALGGLAKLIFDQRKAREADATELRDRRYGFISTLVEVISNIETAKLVIRANRSVKSWTDMVNERIIPGCSRLADMTQQLNNWAKAGSPMFDDTEGVAKELEGINDYFAKLLAEYGNEKQALGELQLKAEEAKQTACAADVTLYSEKSLNLNTSGVQEELTASTDSAYRFRYPGLKLIPQAGQQYLLIPADWAPSVRPAILLARSETLRLEFTTPPGRSASC